jgi:2-polyprenyl-3-methyl-5-hydroxy-6-metoxy-1,4-benzoquinol methylase
MNNYFDKASQDWDQHPDRHERARAVADQIRKQIHIVPGMRALEFGCGTGLLGFNLIQDFAFITFADSSEGMLEQVQNRIRDNKIKNADTLLINIEEGRLPQSYDCIFSLQALHHIKDYEKAIGLLAGHLNPQASLCIADLDQEDGSFHDPGEEVHPGFERGHLKRILQKYGLNSIRESTPFLNKKKGRDYPVFLITGQKG